MNSPEWWFRTLAEMQVARLPRLNRLYRYGTGEHDLPEGDERVRETFRKFQAKARSNYTGLVAESVLERLSIHSFRAGTGASAQDDADAWRIWQANHMDADFPLVARSALYMGEAYMMVGPPRIPGVPRISAEDPREMIVVTDPVDKRLVVAALKVWGDPVAKLWKAALLLPGVVYTYTATMDVQEPAQSAFSATTWTLTGTAQTGLDRVPVVRFPNRMDLSGCTMAEFEDVMDIQDRINGALLDRMVIAKMQAYRQRWVTGAVFEDDDGNPIEPFMPGADLVWNVENPDAKFGDFSQADIRPILEAVQHDVRDLGAISRTPPHYLLGEFINASGDAFAQSETGHVAKVRERQAHFGEAAEDVIRLAYAYLGDPRANALDSEVGWADPQYRSLSEKADAAVKLIAAGVPWRTVMVSVLGYSPQEVDRMEAERATDALVASLNAPQQPQAEPGPEAE